MNETKPTENTDTEAEAETDTEALIRYEYRRKAFCGLDTMCHWDFAHDNGENPFITNTGLQYVYNYKEMKEEGMGIMYFGGAGAGKSYAAAQIVNALTDAGYDCLFTSFRNILTELGTLSNEGKRNYLNQLFRKDLLAFDEYGCEGEGNYNNQMVLYIISNCCQRHIPMLVTTPYHRESLVKSNNALRLQTLSRLWQRCCCIQVVAPPSRRHQNREQMNKTETLLKGPGPWYEESDNYKEPCQEEKEKVRRKEELAKAKAKAKATQLKLIKEGNGKD